MGYQLVHKYFAKAIISCKNSISQYAIVGLKGAYDIQIALKTLLVVGVCGVVKVYDFRI